MFQHTAARRRLDVPFNISNPFIMFQHTAARRRLAAWQPVPLIDTRFQHTAARRRLVLQLVIARQNTWFQHTAARRRLGKSMRIKGRGRYVSTHSRPKAAGGCVVLAINPTCGFNTQPPEGGWGKTKAGNAKSAAFQHTAARRRLDPDTVRLDWLEKFQHTAARRRLALLMPLINTAGMFQHTAARRRLADTWR